MIEVLSPWEALHMLIENDERNIQAPGLSVDQIEHVLAGCVVRWVKANELKHPNLIARCEENMYFGARLLGRIDY